MSEIAVSLENVSKCFKRYAHPAGRLKDLLFPNHSRADQFWALRDINLAIPRGETWGLVGRNGSGKSTLLQILVGTLTATSGNVTVAGRISALLELGSGFNPEFTGRQNVFFNGKILGLNRQEIAAKFDEIAAFADIGDFIDQPVKSYSSGMFVRLAFAVATSVEPDILVVDEALAVGDEVFQRKCFARIQNIQERGGTVLFVSHSARSIIELCNAAVLLDQGELLLQGTPKFIVSKYHKLIYAPQEKLAEIRKGLKELDEDQDKDITSAVNAFKNSSPVSEDHYDPNLVPKSTLSYVPRGAEIQSPHLKNQAGQRVNLINRGEQYTYSYWVHFADAAYNVRFGMLIKTMSGVELGGSVSHLPNDPIEVITPGTIMQVDFTFYCHLLPGVYFLNAGVVGLVDGQEGYLHRCIDAAMFRVQAETGLLATTIVDFQIEAKTIISPHLIEI
ncbi:MAG: ATP-binding cassette domain-containing protein [Cyanobacteria bacterium]|jgi:lipopolysaccharide transport system ATP-binding protein|nr:ATP-binding cassette domain-containing protein [Cyanobacteria bacterium GSL.Bin21]